MELSNIIENLEKSILNDINTSQLHPSICKLILLNIIKNIEDFERNEKNKETEKKE